MVNKPSGIKCLALITNTMKVYGTRKQLIKYIYTRRSTYFALCARKMKKSEHDVITLNVPSCNCDYTIIFSNENIIKLQSNAI